MRLCWFIPQDSGGGVASVALSCCRQAEAVGHDVTLLMMAEATGWSDEYATFRTDELGLCTAEERRQAPRALTAWLDEHPQDVLFVNRCLAADPTLPFVPASTYTVYVVHDTAPMYWRGAVEYEEALDAVIAVSETVAQRFRDQLEHPDRLHVRHNGTLFPERPSEMDRQDDLLFLGGDKPKKGAHDLLDLWPRLLDEGFEGDLHWFGGLSEAFEDQVRALPASQRIHRRGHVDRSMIFEQAAHAKVLLMLSRVESFGMATVEGMGMGCLPVAWDIETGTSEIIEPGRTGFTAPLGDTEALARAVQDALVCHEERVGQAMDVARERFSEEAMWTRYASLLETITDRSVTPRPEAGETPPEFSPPTRYFQLLPESVRNWVRRVVGRSPRLGYWLRGFRGV